VNIMISLNPARPTAASPDRRSLCLMNSDYQKRVKVRRGVTAPAEAMVETRLAVADDEQLPGLEPAGILLGPAPFHHRWPVQAAAVAARGRTDLQPRPV